MVYYTHNKGAFRDILSPNNTLPTQAWGRCMEHFTIAKLHGDCLRNVRNGDTTLAGPRDVITLAAL